MLYSIDNLAVQMVKKWDDSGEMTFRDLTKGFIPNKLGFIIPNWGKNAQEMNFLLQNDLKSGFAIFTIYPIANLRFHRKAARLGFACRGCSSHLLDLVLHRQDVIL